MTLTNLIAQDAMRSEQNNDLRRCSNTFSNNKIRNELFDYYDVKFHKIDIEASDTSLYIKSNSSILVKVIHHVMDTLILELSEKLHIDSVIINDSVYSSAVHLEDTVLIPLKYPVEKNNYIKATIYYHGTVDGHGFFSPLSSGFDASWDINTSWTLSEPFNAKGWFPCKQYLNDKIDSVYVFITVPDSLKAGSNGLLTGIVPVEPGKMRYEWKSYYPIAYYLISFAVSDYQEYDLYAHPKNCTDSIFIQNYVYNRTGVMDIYKSDLDKTADLIELFSDLFGLYPFYKEKYGHCLTPMSGGMEHQTMSTMGNFNFTLVAHELAHQWFGNNVTCSSWQDIWINEGFASYAEFLALEHLESRERADAWMDEAHGFAKKMTDGSIYVPYEESTIVGRIFSKELSYKKGAALLHMIRFELNDDSVFFKVLQTFQEEFKDSVASGMDFKLILEEVSQKSFTNFFNQWYFGEGFPIFKIEWKQINDSVYLEVAQESSSEITPFFTTPVECRFIFDKGDTTILLYHDEPVEKYTLQTDKRINQLQFDPNNWLLNSDTIYKLPSFENYCTITPNPFIDSFFVTFQNASLEREIILTSLDGRIIKKYSAHSDQVNINTSSLPSGTYLITITETNETYTYRAIKQ